MQQPQTKLHPSRYLVKLDTPKGVYELEVPSFLGPHSAKRRAFMTAVASHWGDLNQVKVLDCQLIVEV